VSYFRFRRSVRILPGVRLNIGKRGVSTSFGIRGAHVTVGHGKVRETIGLPGTGLSYTATQGTRQESPSAAPAPGIRKHWPWFSGLMLLALLAFLVHLIRHHGGLP
jgi:hypothetical protein